MGAPLHSACSTQHDAEVIVVRGGIGTYERIGNEWVILEIASQGICRLEISYG